MWKMTMKNRSTLLSDDFQICRKKRDFSKKIKTLQHILGNFKGWECSKRSQKINKDQQRSQKITKDHKRSKKITKDQQSSTKITKNHKISQEF